MSRTLRQAEPGQRAVLRALGLTVLLIAVAVAGLALLPSSGAGRGHGALHLDRALICLPVGDDPCARSAPVSLPHDRRVPEQGGGPGRIHYRLSFTPDPDWDDTGLLLDRFGDTLFLTLNGQALTPRRDGEGPRWHDRNRPSFFLLSPALLQEGENWLDVTLTADPGTWLHLYPVDVGEARPLYLDWLKAFVYRNGFARMAWAVALLQLAIFAMLSRAAPRELGTRWLPPVMASVAVYTWYWSAPNLVPVPQVTRVLAELCVQASVYFLYRFLRAFVKDYPQSGLAAIHGLLLAEALVLALAWLLFSLDLLFLSHAITVVIALYGLALLLVGPEPWYRGVRLKFFPLFGAALVCGVAQWLIRLLGPVSLAGDPGSVAPLLIFAAIAWAFFDRMIQLQRQTDRLNATLRQQVDEKSRELEETYRELARHAEARVLREERQRIMQDLHDGLGGQLVNTLAYVETSGHEDPVLVAALETALVDMGMMIDGLQNQDDLSLMLAMLRGRLEPMLERHHARFEWQVEGRPELRDRSASVSALRIVQEAITNAVKHSGADVIRVETTARSVTVSDDGRGLAAGQGQGTRRGLGLPGMRRRAEELGLDLVIDSSGAGTRIHLFW
ncbi:MAG: histidine kinase [Rhodobacteraceae bacterium]|nr:histidine kinase [Paracoccaceae bacterium]MBR9821730.1 histidine kinase [Paracoccaceae bacterium]